MIVTKLTILTLANYVNFINEVAYTKEYETESIINATPLIKELNKSNDITSQNIDNYKISVLFDDDLFDVLVTVLSFEYRVILWNGDNQIFHGILYDNNFDDIDYKNKVIKIDLYNMLYALKKTLDGITYEQPNDFWFNGLDQLAYLFPTGSPYNEMSGLVLDDTLPTQPPVWEGNAGLLSGNTPNNTVEFNALTVYSDSGYIIDSSDDIVNAIQFLYNITGQKSDGSAYYLYKYIFKIYNGFGWVVSNTEVSQSTAYTSAQYETGGTSTKNYDGVTYAGYVTNGVGGIIVPALSITKNPGYNATTLKCKAGETIADALKTFLYIHQWQLIANLNTISIKYNGSFTTGETVTEYAYNQHSQLKILRNDYEFTKDEICNSLLVSGSVWNDFMETKIKALNLESSIVINLIIPAGEIVGNVIALTGVSCLSPFKFRISRIEEIRKNSNFVKVTAYKIV